MHSAEAFAAAVQTAEIFRFHFAFHTWPVTVGPQGELSRTLVRLKAARAVSCFLRFAEITAFQNAHSSEFLFRGLPFQSGAPAQLLSPAFASRA